MVTLEDAIDQLEKMEKNNPSVKKAIRDLDRIKSAEEKSKNKKKIIPGA